MERVLGHSHAFTMREKERLQGMVLLLMVTATADTSDTVDTVEATVSIQRLQDRLSSERMCL